MDPQWIDIITERPEQHKRVLVRMQGGSIRITSYDMYCWEHYPITHWKPIPDEQRQQQSIS